MKNLVALESTIKMPLLKLSVCSVFASLRAGRILISPGSRLDSIQLKSLGMVSDIVAPNLFHSGGINQAAQIFPEAKIWGPRGAAKLKPHIKWTAELSNQNWPYQNELPMLELRGMPKINECVFIHLESKTLILTDLAFNLTKTEGFGAKLIFSMFGTYKKFATSRFFMSHVKDRTEFSNSLSELFKYDFANIIVSHGESIQGQAKERLRKALLERDIHFS